MIRSRRSLGLFGLCAFALSLADAALTPAPVPAQPRTRIDFGS